MGHKNTVPNPAVLWERLAAFIWPQNQLASGMTGRYGSTRDRKKRDWKSERNMSLFVQPQKQTSMKSYGRIRQQLTHKKKSLLCFTEGALMHFRKMCSGKASFLSYITKPTKTKKKRDEIYFELQFEYEEKWNGRVQHRNVVCHIPSAPTAHRRASRRAVGQTSKAEASNSFCVTLSDPAALRFLHMYIHNLISLILKHGLCRGDRLTL